MSTPSVHLRANVLLDKLGTPIQINAMIGTSVWTKTFVKMADALTQLEAIFAYVTLGSFKVRIRLSVLMEGKVIALRPEDLEVIARTLCP